MDDYSKEKWSADFPDRAGQEVRIVDVSADAGAGMGA